MEKITISKSIRTKILAALLLVSAIAIAITGAALITLSGRILKQNIAQRNLQIARRASNEISLYLRDAVNELGAVAGIISPFSDPWLQDLLLENSSVSLKKFRNISLVDSEGSIAADSGLDRTETLQVDPEMMSAAGEGRTYLSPVMLSADNLPFMVVSLPVRIRGKPGFALAAELNLRNIWDLVDDISFGTSGGAVLTTGDNILIAHPDKTRVLSSADIFFFVGTTAEMPCNGEVFDYKPPEGEPLLMACSPVDIVDWKVMVQQRLSEAYLPLNVVLLRSLMILFAMLVTASAASYYLSRRFFDPLNRLLDGTLRIGKGDLDYRIAIHSNDEIGRLSRSFNNMVGDLKEWSLKLTESEERYRLVTENVHDVIFSLDREGKFIYLNKRIEVISGYKIGRLIGRYFTDFLSEESRRSLADLIRNETNPRDNDNMGIEVELLSKTNKKIDLGVKLVKVFDPSGGVQFYGVARDISERKEDEKKLMAYQQQLRSLASQLSLAEARERKRIASDIHDRISQALALTTIKLGGLQSSLSSPEEEKVLDETLKVIKHTINETHSLIFDLSSPLLYEVGLNAALEQLAEQFQNEHDLKVRFEEDAAPKPLDTDVTVLLFEAVKELLVNVVKHAHASKVRVAMRREKNQVRITVEDNGEGFDSPANAFRVDKAGGYGLFSIRERLSQLGGNLEIESSRKYGTRAAMTVSLNHEKDNT